MKKYLIALFTVVMASTVLAVNPSLIVSPQKLVVTGTPLQGATDAQVTINQKNAGVVVSYYTITSGESWMTVAPSSGNIPTNTAFSNVVVSFVTTNLLEGVYQADITVTQTNAPVTVKTIPVTLKVNQDENLGYAEGPGSIATDPTGVAIGSRTARAVAIGAGTIQIGGGINSTVGSVGIGTNRWIP